MIFYFNVDSKKLLVKMLIWHQRNERVLIEQLALIPRTSVCQQVEAEAPEVETS